VSELPDLDKMGDPSILRGAHFFLQGGAGEADQEFVVIKDDTDNYVYMAVNLSPVL
jgi:hypothetical protein